MHVPYVNIGTSRDTSKFSYDSIRHWWYTYGILYYTLAPSILMLMDGGGSNSSRHIIFKQDLPTLVEAIGIEIRIAHYPPYTSKWNPIEHRVFPHTYSRNVRHVFKQPSIYEIVNRKHNNQSRTKRLCLYF
jgi:hypothetical protein